MAPARASPAPSVPVVRLHANPPAARFDRHRTGTGRSRQRGSRSAGTRRIWHRRIATAHAVAQAPALVVGSRPGARTLDN